MKIEWDVSEFNRFANNLSRMSAFEQSMRKAAQRLAKALLKWMKEFTPVDEYTLIDGWNGNKFAVRKVENGFEVLIVNKTPYAAYVNDGHKAYNQFGGPYQIHDTVSIGPFGKLQGRIQVRTRSRWQRGSSELYVFGHFFVERGILRMRETAEVEQIVFNELQKWWDSL